jgi:hypothetical protein
MTKFCQEELDVRTWQSIEGLEAQSGIFGDTRTANLIRVSDYLRVVKVEDPHQISRSTTLLPSNLLSCPLEFWDWLRWPR